MSSFALLTLVGKLTHTGQVMGRGDLPRMGCRALHHLPAHEDCADANGRCVLKSRFVHRLTSFSAFGFYAGLNVVALVLIFLFLPETKQRTLEELDYVFAVPTSKHVSYQVNKTLPYWFKRYILWRKDAKLEPLYHLDQVDSITVFEKGAGH